MEELRSVLFFSLAGTGLWQETAGSPVIKISQGQRCSFDAPAANVLSSSKGSSRL